MIRVEHIPHKDRREFRAWLVEQPEGLKSQSAAIQIGAWRGQRYLELMATIDKIAARGRGVSRITRRRAMDTMENA